MILESDMYVPSLRWRQGEYQGLMTLSKKAKDRITPFLTIPPIEFDFEAWAPKKSPHEHLFPFPARLKAKWGTRACWIDIDPSLRHEAMDDGQPSYAYIFDNIRSFSAQAIPVVSFDMDEGLLIQLREIIDTDQHGVGLRVRLEDIMQADFEATLLAVLQVLSLGKDEADLLIDLEAPNYDPVEDFAAAFAATFSSITGLNAYRNVVIIGTSFPESMGDIAKGTSTLSRDDWKFYKALTAAMPPGKRRPTYGDYTIVHPSFVALDMRQVKPAGKVVYTTSEAWKILKGGSFRDDRLQMHDHCQAITTSDYFLGSGYSFGDHYIAQCAVKSVGPSNLSQWKKVGINHHMTVVLDDLANLISGS